MIHKPADAEHAGRCMRAAYGTMLQNRRRAARVTVDIPVTARVSDVGLIEATIIDLSIGGIAMQFQQQLQTNWEVLVNFKLPGGDRRIHLSAIVVNANSSGRTGLRFSFMREDDLEILETWLAGELKKMETAEMPA
jgi:hypothetical protein